MKHNTEFQFVRRQKRTTHIALTSSGDFTACTLATAVCNALTLQFFALADSDAVFTPEFEAQSGCQAYGSICRWKNAPAVTIDVSLPFAMLTKTQNNVISYTLAAVFFLAGHAHFALPAVSVTANKLADEAHVAGASLARVFWVLHFARRAIESAFLEKHSAQKVSLADSCGEFVYYWGFSAWIAYSLASSQQLLLSPLPISLCCCGWIAAELTNFYAHFTLSRTCAKDGKRAVPDSRLFSIVCCPHYLAEALSWMFFSLCCPTVGSVVFTSLGAVVMLSYALERHRRYAANDPAFSRSGRKAMIPFIL